LTSVKNAVGLRRIIDERDQDFPLLQYLATDEARFDKLFEDQYLIKTPGSQKWKTGHGRLSAGRVEKLGIKKSARKSGFFIPFAVRRDF
jgi:hypothetical protein